MSPAMTPSSSTAHLRTPTRQLPTRHLDITPLAWLSRLVSGGWLGQRWAGAGGATARRMHVRIKVRGAGGSKQARWIVAVDNRQEPWTVAEAAIAWAIAVYHQAPAVAPRAEAAPLAELRVGRAAAARARA